MKMAAVMTEDIQWIRQESYYLGIDSDAVQALAEDVGIKEATATVAKVRRLLRQHAQEAYPSRTPGFYFAQEAKKCRARVAAERASARLSQELEQAKEASHKAHQKVGDATFDQLADTLAQQWQNNEITFDEYRAGVHALDLFAE